MVSAITCTIRDEMLENVFENFSNQLWTEKELIIILNNDEMSIDKWQEKAAAYKNVSIFQLPEEKTLGECLNYGIEKAKYDIIAKFDDDDYYSPYYLTEAMEAFKNKNPHIVGKGSSYMYFSDEKLLVLRKIGNENKFGRTSLKGGTLVFKKEIYPSVKFPALKGSGEDSTFVRECIKKNFSIYTTSKYNYVYIRKGNSQFHTFKKSLNYFKKKSTIIGKTADYKTIATRNMSGNS